MSAKQDVAHDTEQCIEKMKKQIGIIAIAALAIVLVLGGCKKDPKTPSNGTENGHEWVDLGLPSGLLWATCNIGADKPEAYGDYFAWGETTPQADNAYDWNSYKYHDGNKMTKYTETDGLETLESSDDAATANWGGAWRMPTKAEMQELMDNTTCEWTVQNGVNGLLFTSSNGNTIFLPAAGGRYDSGIFLVGSNGYYWSASLYTDYPGNAWYFNFDSEDFDIYAKDARFNGFSVRPVCSVSHK